MVARSPDARARWAEQGLASRGPLDRTTQARFELGKASPRLVVPRKFQTQHDQPARLVTETGFQIQLGPAINEFGAPWKKPDALLDDPDLAAFFAALLRADGLRVEIVGSGLAALERVAVSRPALIISDIAMPGMSGYELCRAVRSRGFLDIPFIFCTVLGAQELRIEGLRCGADDYLVKPVEPQELRLKVRNHIARQNELRERFPASA